MAKQIAPKDVFGRDKLIAQMWKTLSRSSAVFTAERRIGKTTILKKMVAEEAEGNVVLYQDLEKIDTPIRFVEVVLTDLKKYLSKKVKVDQWFKNFINSIEGTEIGGMTKISSQKEKDWQSILEKALADACSNQSDQLIFLWDEVPYMLQKISALERRSGSQANSALTIVDSLRALRNQHSNLRMVFTGSVGLHHVLEDLRDGQYASQPINDMEKVDIGPLLVHDAKELTQALIRSEEIQCKFEDAVIDRIVQMTDSVPFYIHRVVTRIALIEEIATPEHCCPKQQKLKNIPVDFIE